MLNFSQQQIPLFHVVREHPGPNTDDLHGGQHRASVLQHGLAHHPLRVERRPCQQRRKHVRRQNLRRYIQQRSVNNRFDRLQHSETFQACFSHEQRGSSDRSRQQRVLFKLRSTTMYK